jgi:hypothetical protein
MSGQRALWPTGSARSRAQIMIACCLLPIILLIACSAAPTAAPAESLGGAATTAAPRAAHEPRKELCKRRGRYIAAGPRHTYVNL